MGRLPLILLVALGAGVAAPAPWTTAAAQQPPAVSLATWTDPVEGAFALDLPQGWPVQGGTVRHSPTRALPVVEARSPDAAIYLFVGDPSIPEFMEPNSMLAASGFPEGSRYSPDGGPGVVVQRYTPGAAFARRYVARKFRQGLHSVVITGERDRPDLSAEANAILQRSDTPMIASRLDSGEILFTAYHGARPVAGYALAITGATRGQAPGMEGMGLWEPLFLSGFVAPPERAAEAGAILARMVASLRFDPEWMSAQSRISLESAQRMARAQQQANQAISARLADISRTLGETSDIIVQGWEQGQETLDRVYDRMSERTRDTTRVLDPEWNERHEVPDVARYYWICPGGQIIGTDLWVNPDPSVCRPMSQP